MADASQSKSPVNQLVELLVYAPVGLFYEREELLDQVVTKGRSQVQLMRLMAKMAAEREGGAEAAVNDIANQAADMLTKRLVDFGVAVGVVPKPSKPKPATDRVVIDITESATSSAPGTNTEPDTASDADEISPPQAIENYDSLNAKTVISKLDDLTPDDVQAVFEYESAHRNRKTVLAKAERLLA